MDNPNPFLQSITDQDPDACWNWNEKVNFFPSDDYNQFELDFSERVPDGQIASAANPRFAGSESSSMGMSRKILSPAMSTTPGSAWFGGIGMRIARSRRTS